MDCYIDTHIVTCFRFLERPEEFLFERATNFCVTMPIVRELERIKDEHFSKAQRGRARSLLDILDVGPTAFPEHPGLTISLKGVEFNDRQMAEHGFTCRDPDDFFVAAVYASAHAYRDPPPRIVLITDDVGVRVRAKERWRQGEAMIVTPDPSLRYESEEFNLPQIVKASIKELAVQLAAELRGPG